MFDFLGNDWYQKIIVGVVIFFLTTILSFIAGRVWGKWKANRQWASKHFMDRIIVSLNLFNGFADLLRHGRILLFEKTCNGVDGALADEGSGKVDAAHAGLRGEGDELGVNTAQVAAAKVVLLFRQDNYGSAFGGLVR